MKNSTIDSKEIVKKIIEIGYEKSAFDFYAVDVSECSDITDYFILMSCNNDRQIKAVTNAISSILKKEYNRNQLHLDGNFESRWVVLDYSDVIIHIFHNEIREYYDLETLWKNGKTLDLSFIEKNN